MEKLNNRFENDVRVLEDGYRYDYSLDTGTYHDLCAVDLTFRCHDNWLPVLLDYHYDNGEDDVRVNLIGVQETLKQVPKSLYLSLSKG